MFGRLNDFAEAFVLLHEIEHEIRDLIRDLVDSTGLATMIAAIHLPPRSTAPVTLEEFTFNQSKGIISARANWPTFEPLFASR